MALPAKGKTISKPCCPQGQPESTGGLPIFPVFVILNEREGSGLGMRRPSHFEGSVSGESQILRHSLRMTIVKELRRTTSWMEH